MTQIEQISLEAWKRIPETVEFLKRLQAQRNEFLIQAENLADSEDNEQKVIKLLIKAKTIREEVIDYARPKA